VKGEGRGAWIYQPGDQPDRQKERVPEQQQPGDSGFGKNRFLAVFQDELVYDIYNAAD